MGDKVEEKLEPNSRKNKGMRMKEKKERNHSKAESKTLRIVYSMWGHLWLHEKYCKLCRAGVQ